MVSGFRSYICGLFCLCLVHLCSGALVSLFTPSRLHPEQCHAELISASCFPPLKKGDKGGFRGISSNTTNQTVSLTLYFLLSLITQLPFTQLLSSQRSVLFTATALVYNKMFVYRRSRLFPSTKCVCFAAKRLFHRRSRLFLSTKCVHSSMMSFLTDMKSPACNL